LSIENFTARFDLSKKIFRYSFLLKNKTSTYSVVSGYIFIILKSESLGSEHWLAYPQTVLVNGAPQNFRDGELFPSLNKKSSQETYPHTIFMILLRSLYFPMTAILY